MDEKEDDDEDDDADSDLDKFVATKMGQKRQNSNQKSQLKRLDDRFTHSNSNRALKEGMTLPQLMSPEAGAGQADGKKKSGF